VSINDFEQYTLSQDVPPWSAAARHRFGTEVVDFRLSSYQSGAGVTRPWICAGAADRFSRWLSPWAFCFHGAAARTSGRHGM